MSGTKATIALTVPRIVSMGGIFDWFFVLPNRRDNQFIVLLSLGTIRLIRKSILCYVVARLGARWSVGW